MKNRTTDLPIFNGYIFYSGDDIERRVKPSINGVAVDLTGYTSELKLKKVKSQDGFDLELNIDNGGVSIEDAANGIIKFTINNAQSSVLDGVYHYDLSIISVTGKITTILLGNMEFKADI